MKNPIICSIRLDVPENVTAESRKHKEIPNLTFTSVKRRTKMRTRVRQGLTEFWFFKTSSRIFQLTITDHKPQHKPQPCTVSQSVSRSEAYFAHSVHSGAPTESWVQPMTASRLVTIGREDYVISSANRWDQSSGSVASRLMSQERCNIQKWVIVKPTRLAEEQ